MLDFSDKPYRFFPPKPNSFLIKLAGIYNRKFILPGRKHRITRIELRGTEHVKPIVQRGDRILLLPNHSTHSDPQVMLDVQRQLKLDTLTMAAYDVFLRGRIQAWFMQSIGCFSVDREGSDAQAMKCAVDSLVQGDRALTIFPEGNVALMNDQVFPFLSGAAFIAMRAQKKLGADKPVYAIPVSLKFTYVADVRQSLKQHVEKLESILQLDPAKNSSLRVRLRNLGVQILSRNLRQRGYLPPDEPSSDTNLSGILQNSAVQIIEKLEQKIELTSKPTDTPMDRIRRIRAAIHQIRIDESQQLDHRVAATWADEAILAMRILSYSGSYISEFPSVDRHAESLEKLREDLVERFVAPLGDREAIVQFGKPICLAEHLDVMKKDSRNTLSSLTQTFERQVQQGLDDVRGTLTSIGVSRLEDT